MSRPLSASDLDAILPGAPDLRAQAIAWLEAMAKERRCSPKTVEAYGRDLRQFPRLPAHAPRRAASIAAVIALKPATCAPSCAGDGRRASRAARSCASSRPALLRAASRARGARHGFGLLG
jgi:integrase/recombinase XerC